MIQSYILHFYRKSELNNKYTLERAQTWAAFTFILMTGLAVAAVAIRGLIQGSHPTFIGVFLIWILFLLLYSQKKRIGINNILIILSVLTSLAQFFVFKKLGLMSAGSFILMANFSLAALVREFRITNILSALNLFPLIAFLILNKFNHPFPIPESPYEYARAASSWTSYTVLSIIFGGIIVANTNFLAGYIKAQSNRYRKSIFESMLVLSLMRDHETGAHLDRCTKYASALLQACKKTGYEKSSDINLDEFTEAVRLHDIGKIGVSDNILLKEGKLTASETTEMQKHSQLGYDMIKQISESTGIQNDPVIKLGKEIALGHHENWDGSGYPYGAPKGMYGANIPLSCRIMAIIDVYDALRSVRPYKNAYSHSEAIEIMTSMIEKKFDPKLFEVFLQVSDDFNEIFESSKE